MTRPCGWIGRKPRTLAKMVESMKVIKGLVAGEEVDYAGKPLRIPWISDGWDLPMWAAGYGPKALATIGRHADGFILQLADPQILEWTVAAVRAAALDAGRDPREIARLRGGRPPTWATTSSTSATNYGGSEGWSATMSTTWSTGMARTTRRWSPRCWPTTSQPARATTTPTTEGPATPRPTSCRDAIVDRFCVLGTAEDHIAKLQELRELGMDQFGIYLMHDDRENTLNAYGETVIPGLVDGG